MRAGSPTPGASHDRSPAGAAGARRGAGRRVIDGHPATLSWLGAVRGQRIQPLGVDRFGQSGDIPDLYAAYGIDAEAIEAAVERTLARRAR